MFLILTVFWTLFLFTGLHHAKGIEQWDCQGSYQYLGNNRSTCNGPPPFLLFSRGKDILSIDIDGTNLKTIVRSAGSSVLLDFDYQEQRLYWLDPNRGFIQRILLNKSKRERMRAVIKGATQFTVDWKNRNIYWSNQQKGTIEWTDMSGKKARILLRGLVHPTFISVDPVEGLLFWTSSSLMSVIQKSNLNATTIISVAEMRGDIKALALDTAAKKIYWILSNEEDADQSIGSCTYYGDSVTVIKKIGHYPRQNNWGLSVFSDYIYYTERKSSSIWTLNKYTGKETVIITLRPSVADITDIKIVPQLTSSYPYTFGSDVCALVNDLCTETCQISGVSQQCTCKDGFQLSYDGKHCEDINECALWSHGCTLGCENIPGSYYCSCPKGYVLLPDNKSCHDDTPCVQDKNCSHGCVQTAGGPVCFCPEGSVLGSDGKTCRGCFSPDNGGCSQICRRSRDDSWECDCFPGYILQEDKKSCLASGRTGPRPFLLFANMQDIQRMNFDGTQYESPLASQMGRVLALDYDPVENKIYFAHTALKCIESAKMDGSGREKLIVEAMDTPEGLAVDAINRKLYWTDRGKSCIEVSDLNGWNRKIIVKENIQQPRGICVHPRAGRIFWTDIGPNPHIGSCSLDGRVRMDVISSNLIWPSGITVDILTNKLYWCDTKRSVVEFSDLDGSNRLVLSQNDVGHPFGIAVFEDHIWLSDWLQPSLVRMHKREGNSWIRVQGNMKRPSALVVVHPLVKLAITDNIPKPRKDITVGNDTTYDELFLHGPLTTVFYGGVDDSHASNALVAEILVSDERFCVHIQCDINARCALSEDGPRCQCLEGYTGNGRTCNDIDECLLQITACDLHGAECINMEGGYICKCMEGFLGNGLECSESFTTAGTVNMTVNDTSGRSHTKECPASHDHFCFHGTCRYFPDLDEYACVCIPGYFGERCQTEDLKWLERQTTQLKIRNVTISVSVIVLLLVLGLVFFAVYYYRHQLKQSRNTGRRHGEQH
ncbi:pro-epidermal growth factor isoform X3 [Hyla sarda]|uniref:pro-epidermal growth factor isoform X3 n=1 Tax=Hyla sarda TaxID=327740 RepID=UPI0024C28F31|nr:pro-epidermal growth factor isoform X3 [Hyla sarda]